MVVGSHYWSVVVLLWVVLVRSFVLVVAVVFICGVVDYHFGRGSGLDWSMGVEGTSLGAELCEKCARVRFSRMGVGRGGAGVGTGRGGGGWDVSRGDGGRPGSW